MFKIKLSITGDLEDDKSGETATDTVGALAQLTDADVNVDTDVNVDAGAKGTENIEKSAGKESLKEESSAEMQRLTSGEIVDEIKEATLVQGSSAALEDSKDNSNQESDNLTKSTELNPGDSVKSSDTALSKFETLDISEDIDGFVTAETLPDVMRDETTNAEEIGRLLKAGDIDGFVIAEALPDVTRNGISKSLKYIYGKIRGLYWFTSIKKEKN